MPRDPESEGKGPYSPPIVKKLIPEQQKQSLEDRAGGGDEEAAELLDWLLTELRQDQE